MQIEGSIEGAPIRAAQRDVFGLLTPELPPLRLGAAAELAWKHKDKLLAEPLESLLTALGRPQHLQALGPRPPEGAAERRRAQAWLKARLQRQDLAPEVRTTLLKIREELAQSLGSY